MAAQPFHESDIEKSESADSDGRVEYDPQITAVPDIESVQVPQSATETDTPWYRTTPAKIGAGALALLSAGAIGFGLRGNDSSEQPRGQAKTALVPPLNEPELESPITVQLNETPSDAPIVSQEYPELNYAVELFIKDGFVDHLKTGQVTFLDGVTIVSGDYTGITENPALVVAQDNGPGQVGVIFDFNGRPLKPNEQLVFVGLREDGVVDVIGPKYIGSVFKSEDVGLVSARARVEGNSVSYSTDSVEHQSLGILYYGVDNAKSIANQRLAEQGKTIPLSIEGLIALSTRST